MSNRYDFETFQEGGLPALVSQVTFVGCTFTGRLAEFDGCEFHDCDLRDATVTRLTNCKLFSCQLDGCDFTSANVAFSETHPGSPSSAAGCKWRGILAINDCRFWGGLVVDEEAPWLFLAMAMIPASPAKDHIYRLLPAATRRRLRAELRRPFRAA